MRPGLAAFATSSTSYSRQYSSRSTPSSNQLRGISSLDRPELGLIAIEQYSVPWYKISTIQYTLNYISNTYLPNPLQIPYEIVYLPTRTSTLILQSSAVGMAALTPTPAAVSESASTSTSTSSESDLLPFSPALCDHVSEGHPLTQDLKKLLSMHLNGNAKALRCSWYVQAKKAQESYHARKHELEMKSKLKKKIKELTKQKKEARLAQKRAEGYTCRRRKMAKFDSNTKLHEHIRNRHAKKPKPAQQSAELVALPPTPPVSSSQSVTSSPPASPKLVAESPATSTPSEPLSSSVATPRKPISWAEIASRPVAPKPSHLPIATPKSVCNPLEKPAANCPLAPLTPPRTPSPKHQGIRIQKPYLTVDDQFRMFAGKPKPFGQQPRQNKPSSPHTLGKCSPRSSGPIQTCITSYFNAAASPASKSAKSEAFGPTHARGNLPRQLSVSPRSASRTSFPFRFSKVSRSTPVCGHC